MALFYEHSKYWRAIIHVTKDNPRAMAAFSFATLASCTGLGYLTYTLFPSMPPPDPNAPSKLSDDPARDPNLPKSVLENRDLEMRRTGEIGRSAMAAIIAQTQGTEVGEGYMKVGIPKAPLHPTVEKKEKERRDARKAEVAAGEGAGAEAEVGKK